MAFTVQDIVNRVEAALDRKAVSGGLTQLGAFVDTHWFMWIKDAYNKISDICRTTLPALLCAACRRGA